MNPEKNIETQLEQLAQAISSGDSFVHGVMSRIETSSDTLQKTQSIHINLVRRLCMKTSVKFAAAAIVLIAVFVSLTLFQTVTPAYAIEQTVQACHSVRFIHIRKFIPQQELPIMIWAEFFENGQPKSIRLNLPDWASGGDGEKQVIWKDNVAQILFKKKNGILRVREQKLADEILKTVQENNPEMFIRKIVKIEDGQFTLQCVQINLPGDKAQPICITTFIPPDKNKKVVMYVDQATKLLLSLETYGLRDGEFVLENTCEFYDYNQPIDPNMFVFDNIPADVTAVDQVANAIGLEQGQMTNDQVAIEVVRRFWQAIIDSDFNTASQMYDGTPAETLKAFAEKLKNKTVKIISVGPVKPHPMPETKGVIVPCTIEFEVNGQTIRRPFDKIGVRQVYNQPGRWTIFGGI